jgi:hypothetical protein
VCWAGELQHAVYADCRRRKEGERSPSSRWICNEEMCLQIYNGALCLQSSGSRSAEMAGLTRLE